MHTIILGNGIIGMSIAFRLLKSSKPNDIITIVGKKSRVCAATFAAPAMLNSFAELEGGSLKSDIDLYRFELSRLATKLWPAFEKEVNETAVIASNYKLSDIDTYESGTYIINNTAADDLDDENFDAIVEGLKKYKEPFSHLSPSDIPNYMPDQKNRAARAIYINSEGWVNPRLLMYKIELVLESHPNVKFIDADVKNLNQINSEVGSAVLDNGEHIIGDKFVLATGANSTEVLNQSNFDVPIQRIFYGVGVSVEIKSPDYQHVKCIRTPNRGLACGLYTAPYKVAQNAPKDHIIIGASNFLSPVPYHHGRLTSVETIMRGAMEQINVNFYRADFVKVNIGWRPTSQDTYPLLGKTSLKNLIVATGTKREGFHLAPIISESIVSILLDKSIDERFLMFSPERKVMRTLTRDEAISKSVRHQMSAAYQHGFQPSINRMPDQIKLMYKDALERLHDQVGAYDWGIPPEMLDMYRYGHAKV